MTKQDYIRDINNSIDPDHLSGIISYLEILIERNSTGDGISINDKYALIGMCTHKKYLIFSKSDYVINI